MNTRTALLLAAVLAACSTQEQEPNSGAQSESATPAKTAESSAEATPVAAKESSAAEETVEEVVEEASTETPTMSIYELEAETLEGEPAALSSYRGKVTLVVNVASRCGYTPQYAGLQALHAELKDRGFAVLGFPSNDFGAQEPGSATEIREFCSSKFSVDFPMFAKVKTKAGDGQSPVYERLSAAVDGQLPNWNFCKYLVGKDGQVLGFYPSRVAPDDAALRQQIEAALQ
jgi:glutathione peroxidase